jgi:hypothetical protein
MCGETEHTAQFGIKSTGAAVDNLAYLRCAAPMAKYPQPSDVYECELYPGRTCRVLSVHNAQVTFQWLGDYSRIELQVVPVNRFIVDFKLVDAEA